MERNCLIPQHYDQQILAYCVTEGCKKPARVVCFKCVNDHSGHQMIQLQEEQRFLQQPNIVYTMIRSKLDLMKRHFLKGISALEEVLLKNYVPESLNNIGNQQITNKINCILKLERVQKLINDRLDNIFENTLKQVKITYQDLTTGNEFQCYEQLQKQNYQEATRLIDETLQQNSKNIFLKLAKAEICSVQKRCQDARRIYEEVLGQDDSNPWAYFELNKLLNDQERR
ncbi:unnamed protein product [Paramecium sonneborni]|uniref:Tetratricopeptide repeat protein n=1 Tax=Paramecium sonneborni TaxID=65129 RepID=A0A8S1QUQ0_9CILI|nr:unnamed protein product [Paramecium sonneborni]